MLYALVVGINAYQTHIPIVPNCKYSPLQGCVSDTQKIIDYLQGDPALEVDIRHLTDARATKAAITEAFRTHLAKAGPEDTALFYFSGHGIAEAADMEAWPTETDGRLECLACYNDGDPCLLADKELRYLLQQVARRDEQGREKGKPPHILTVFDCCHSGDNTRNGYVGEMEAQARERRIPCVAPQRPWEEFLFAGELPREELLRQGLNRAIPETPHLQMAACEPHESAWESGGGGVFTGRLLQVLEQSGGALSYNELASRIRHFLRNGRFDQKPMIYAPGESGHLRELLFLGRRPEGGGRSVQLLYNQREGWTLTAGALDGLNARPDENLRLQLKEGGTWNATVRELRLDYALLQFAGDVPADKSTTYRVLVEGLSTNPLKLYTDNFDFDRQDWEAFLQKLQSDSPFLSLTDEESDADFVLHARYESLFLTYPHDPFRPVVRPLPLEAPELLSPLRNVLLRLAENKYLQELHNPASQLSKLQQPPLRIEVELEGKDGTFAPAKVQADGSVDIYYHLQDGKWSGAFRLKVKNEFSENLYIGALYLTNDHRIYTRFLKPEVYILEPGNEVFFWQHQSKSHLQSRVPLSLEDWVQDYNWPFTTEHIQLILSNEPFTLEGMSRDPLAMPWSADELMKAEHRAVKKGSALDEEEEGIPTITGPDWMCASLTLRFHNPEHNRIPRRRLQSLLQHEETAGFALGLYLQGVDGNKPSHEPRPEIEILQDDEVRSKGALFDLAVGLGNWGARLLRNRRFRRHMRKYPDRLLMVSEGDSWFQHPLVKDTIDHLSLFYNIYSTGAAGDEMRGYLMGGEFRSAVEDMEKEYEGKKVQFFLLSGGGNDILGSQFSSYIKSYDEVEEKPEGEDPARFFNETFHNEMEDLMDFYDTLIAHWQTYRPELHLITHGYDYVIPKGPEEEGMSWLGAPMTERGILRPKDRKALINHMIDTFNDRLLEITGKYPNVTHVDNRRRVRPEQWYDEIHPNAEGFQNVALRFVKTIDAIMRETVK